MTLTRADWKKYSSNNKIKLEMSLLIPGSIVRYLWTCFDSWAGMRQHAKPLRHSVPREERWAGQISISELLEGKLKIEDLTRISSTSVSTPLPVISHRELLWHDISLLQVSKGTKSWTLVLQGSWPHWPPTSCSNKQFLSIFQFFNWWCRANDAISAEVNMCPNYSECRTKWGYTRHFKRPELIFLHISL